MKAKIFEIKRFAVHDGDGIRTTVFFMGCPLKCVWCHNPEGLKSKTQLAYYKNKCVGCGECAKVCKNKVHVIDGAFHSLKRELCVGCGECESICCGNALKLQGKEMSVDEVVSAVLEDKEFYDCSGGGVTLSGGECLMQWEFCAGLLKECKKYGINTAVDTCGFVSRNSLEGVIPYTDKFLYDIKAMDKNVHKKCTGQENGLILDNLMYLSKKECSIEIRYPLVKGYNDKECEKTAKFLKELNGIEKVKILRYHNFAGSKYEALDIKNTLPTIETTDEDVLKAVNIMKKWGINAVAG